MTSPIKPTETNSMDQTDFLKLFMQELSYQDPLKPIDNREFMAQMAQFASLQETQNTNGLLLQLLHFTAANQSLALLGKTIQMNDSDATATVSRITFLDDASPQLSLREFPGKVISLKDIREVLG